MKNTYEKQPYDYEKEYFTIQKKKENLTWLNILLTQVTKEFNHYKLKRKICEVFIIKKALTNQVINLPYNSINWILYYIIIYRFNIYLILTFEA